MQVYIDGSCRPSTKLGAYAALFIKDDATYTLSGKEEGVTNNIMELKALVIALKFITTHNLTDVQIYSDSQYVVQGTNEWLAKWKSNGYKTTTGKVKNVEIWKEIDQLWSATKDCTLSWVKGHAKNEHNNAVDKIVFGLTAHS